jgi:hypothetical protein
MLPRVLLALNMSVLVNMKQQYENPLMTHLKTAWKDWEKLRNIWAVLTGTRSDSSTFRTYNSSVVPQHRHLVSVELRRKLVCVCNCYCSSRNSSGGKATKLRAGWLKSNFNFWKGKKNSLFLTASIPTLEPTQPPFQWLPGGLIPQG